MNSQNVDELRAATQAARDRQLGEPRSSRRPSVAGHMLHWVLAAAGATALFVAYQHLKINGAPAPAYVCLAGAALLALSPLKALGHAMFTVERGAMHLVHVVAGLALMALPVSGLVSGTPVLTHAALAPFAMMGAAQALMHSGKPRNAAQRQAMRSFVTSLRSCLEMTGARSPGKIKLAAGERRLSTPVRETGKNGVSVSRYCFRSTTASWRSAALP